MGTSHDEMISCGTNTCAVLLLLECLCVVLIVAFSTYGTPHTHVRAEAARCSWLGESSLFVSEERGGLSELQQQRPSRDTLSDTSLEYDLRGEGFHRRLHVHATARWHNSRNTTAFISKNFGCSVGFVVQLSPHVFADQYELQRAREQHECLNFHVQGEVDLEKPVIWCGASTIHIRTLAMETKQIMEQGGLLTIIEANTAVPLHARYPFVQHAVGNAAVANPNIRMFLVCNNFRGKTMSGPGSEEADVEATVLLDKMTWMWSVPNGSTAHEFFATASTIAGEVFGSILVIALIFMVKQGGKS